MAKYVKVIQINEAQVSHTKKVKEGGRPKIIPIVDKPGGKKYFCKTSEELATFKENHPNMKIEVYRYELETMIADAYLSDPENKEAFKKVKETVNV